MQEIKKTINYINKTNERLKKALEYFKDVEEGKIKDPLQKIEKAEKAYFEMLGKVDKGFLFLIKVFDKFDLNKKLLLNYITEKDFEEMKQKFYDLNLKDQIDISISEDIFINLYVTLKKENPFIKEEIKEIYKQEIIFKLS